MAGRPPWGAGCCPAKAEGLGSVFAEVGTSIVAVAVGIFFVAGVLPRFAYEAAGCPLPGNDAAPPAGSCEGRVAGLRPSSVISVVWTITGVCTALVMPYAGSVVDHTHHRRSFGVACAAGVVLASGLLMAATRESWLYITVVGSVASAGSYNGHSVARWAYVRELVDSDEEVASIVAWLKAWQLVAQLIFIGAVVAITTALDLEPLSTMRVGIAISIAVAIPLLVGAWILLGPRAPKHGLGGSQSLWLAGARQLALFGALAREHPGVVKMLAVASLNGAAMAAFVVALLTVATSLLAASSTAVAIVAAINLLAGAVGAGVYRGAVTALGHRGTLVLAQCLWLCVIAAFAVFIDGPEDMAVVYGLSVASGVALGVAGPSVSGFLTALMPAGREAELWGYGIFATIALTWLPPLVFTAINEVANDPRLGLASLGVYFFLALVVGATVGDQSQVADAATAPAAEDPKRRA